MQLRDMKPGQRGVVKGFLPGNTEYRKKLFSLSVLPNTRFEVTRVAVRRSRRNQTSRIFHQRSKG